jgi:hypothetical protein
MSRGAITRDRKCSKRARGPPNAHGSIAMKNRWMWALALPSVMGVSAVLHACGSEGSRGGLPSEPAFDAGFTDAPTTPRADAGMALPPPEVEVRRSFQTPQAGGRFVYVANPTRDTVAVIDSTTLAIQTVETGDGPTYLSTIPGQDVALVINVNSHSLTVLRTTATGTTASNVPIVAGANALAIAPDGRHALAYFDSGLPGATVSNGSFQDLSVITLEAGNDRAVQLSVGFRPVDVLFAADGSRAFVVTEDGISILRFADITGPTIIPNVSLEDSTITPRSDGGVDGSASDATLDAAPDGGLRVPARDVSITPDGRYAVARVEGTGALRLVDLATRAITAIDVDGAVTDLDVSPSGMYALAVVRERSQVLRIPLPMGFTDPTTITRTEVTGEFVGSVDISPDGARALLYTTALPIERVTLMELTSVPSLQVVRMRKAVRAVAFAPDGRTALIVHTSIGGDPAQAGLDLETQIDRSFGYTLFDTATRFAKLQLTSADVGPFAIVPDGSHAFVLLRNDARSVAEAQRVSLRSFVIDTVALGSPPLSVGAVPGTARAFIGQDHPEGRITFVDWNSGALQSVTGFELNSRVVN